MRCYLRPGKIIVSFGQIQNVIFVYSVKYRVAWFVKCVVYAFKVIIPAAHSCAPKSNEQSYESKKRTIK
jgi:hypothetical protein